jgi:hypothetical protein
MSGARILYPQFRDEQADSRYPFADGATLTTTAGTLTIARDTFIDASLYIIDAGKGLYISQITVTSDTVTLFVGGSATRNLVSTKYPTNTPPADGILELFDSYGRPAGMLLSQRLKLFELSAWPTGEHTFASSATEFVASVSIPAQEPGVRGILTADDTLLTGDLWLIGDQGVQVRQENEGVIRIDIIGEPLFLRALCEDKDKFSPKRFVKTINGCPPDEYGNFIFTSTGHIAPDTVLRIYPSCDSLVIDTVGKKVV